MNTEQLKTDRQAIEILREEYKAKLTGDQLVSLHREIDEFCDDEELEPRNAILSAMDIFASQESKRAVDKDRESRWISVKDRLPEEGKEVLVWSDRYGRTFAALTGQNKHGSIWLYSGDPIVTFNAPSHWQPLPEPPKL